MQPWPHLICSGQTVPDPPKSCGRSIRMPTSPQQQGDCCTGTCCRLRCKVIPARLVARLSWASLSGAPCHRRLSPLNYTSLPGNADEWPRPTYRAIKGLPQTCAATASQAGLHYEALNAKEKTQPFSGLLSHQLVLLTFGGGRSGTRLCELDSIMLWSPFASTACWQLRRNLALLCKNQQRALVTCSQTKIQTKVFL